MTFQSGDVVQISGQTINMNIASGGLFIYANAVSSQVITIVSGMYINSGQYQISGQYLSSGQAITNVVAGSGAVSIQVSGTVAQVNVSGGGGATSGAVVYGAQYWGGGGYGSTSGVNYGDYNQYNIREWPGIWLASGSYAYGPGFYYAAAIGDWWAVFNLGGTTAPIYDQYDGEWRLTVSGGTGGPYVGPGLISEGGPEGANGEIPAGCIAHCRYNNFASVKKAMPVGWVDSSRLDWQYWSGTGMPAGVYFCYLSGKDNWQAVCALSGAKLPPYATSGTRMTTTDTGWLASGVLASGTTGYNKFNIQWVSGRADFWIDNNLCATLTSNVPIAAYPNGDGINFGTIGLIYTASGAQAVTYYYMEPLLFAHSKSGFGTWFGPP